jgi:hypothetical protein
LWKKTMFQLIVGLGSSLRVASIPFSVMIDT